MAEGEPNIFIKGWYSAWRQYPMFHEDNMNQSLFPVTARTITLLDTIGLLPRISVSEKELLSEIVKSALFKIPVSSVATAVSMALDAPIVAFRYGRCTLGEARGQIRESHLK